ncbi:MAG TPA: GNAT family N-acetyltransferase, partial [Phenylobacterium sp.]
MPNSAPLRTATPADAPAIRDLTRTAYAAWVPLIGREPTPMTVDYETAVLAHPFDLLEVAGRLVALIETVRREDHLYIVNIAVHPQRHGQGLGRRLLTHAERLAEQAGLSEVQLLTNQLMSRNIELYRRFGYAVDREEPFAGGGVTVHMRKPLARRLVFLPGAGADPHFWRPLADRLPAAWSKRFLGWPGLGDQPADADVNSVDDLVRLVEAQLGDGPADLLAQSMGGVVALQVALRNPGKVRRLV